MTRSKEQAHKAVFGKLKGLRRKLHTHGVPCTYARSVLSHDNRDTGFSITYRASDNNGDTTLLPELSIRTAEGSQNFDHLTFDQGIARLRGLFQTQDSTDGQNGNQHRLSGRAARLTQKEQDVNDPTESIRRERIAEINVEPGSREALEAKYGQVWDKDELISDFEAIGFMAPLVVVRRRSDGQKGSLEFQHSPRLYFNWQPHEGK